VRILALDGCSTCLTQRSPPRTAFEQSRQLESSSSSGSAVRLFGGLSLLARASRSHPSLLLKVEIASQSIEHKPLLQLQPPLFTPIAHSLPLSFPFPKMFLHRVDKYPIENPDRKTTTGGLLSIASYLALLAYIGYYVNSALTSEFPTNSSVIVFPQHYG
jgi:hypothetical protein